MDRTLVFLKSEKGNAALGQHSHEITVNQRRILIMVDGRRTVGDLIKDAMIFMNVEEEVESLYQNGYITPIDEKPPGFFETPVFRPTSPPRDTPDGGPPQPRPSTMANAIASHLTEPEKMVLEEESVEFLGPMGSLLCEEILPYARSVDEALAKLAGQLPPAEAQQFHLTVKRRLSV